jgi:1,2-diacylglycerol 3-alpha-glucosyltransferase
MPKVGIVAGASSWPWSPQGRAGAAPKTARVDHLRIGFFTEIYRPVVNGVVASIDGLAEGLRARGNEVYCFAPKMPGYNDAEGPVFRMPSLPLPTPTPYRLTLPLVSRRNVNNIIKRLSLVHVHSPFVTGWMGMRYARRYGMPLVYTYHTQLEAYAHYFPFEPHATRYAASQLTRTFANLADAVVVPTAAMGARLRDLGVTSRIEVVPSGIDVHRFGSGHRDDRLRRRVGAKKSDRLILCVSRLAKEKNVELLLEALARTGDPSLKLAIAGDGPARDDLEDFARECGVYDRTCFLGIVARDQLPDLYASCDAFAMPSETETQGLVMAEALSAGARVIAADAAQNLDVLGGAGITIPATPEAFAAAFLAVPAVGDPLFAAHARKSAGRFAIDSQIDKMSWLYETLIQPLSPEERPRYLLSS